VRVAVVARGAVGRDWIRAGAGRVVDAGSGDVALVGRRAGDADAVIDAGATPGGADVAGGVRVAVVARGAVGGGGIRAGAGRVVDAGPGDVALVGRGAGDAEAMIDARAAPGRAN